MGPEVLAWMVGLACAACFAAGGYLLAGRRDVLVTASPAPVPPPIVLPPVALAATDPPETSEAPEATLMTPAIPEPAPARGFEAPQLEGKSFEEDLSRYLDALHGPTTVVLADASGLPIAASTGARDVDSVAALSSEASALARRTEQLLRTRIQAVELRSVGGDAIQVQRFGPPHRQFTVTTHGARPTDADFEKLTDALFHELDLDPYSDGAGRPARKGPRTNPASN